MRRRLHQPILKGEPRAHGQGSTDVPTLVGTHLLIMLSAWRQGGQVSSVFWKDCCISAHSSFTMGTRRAAVPTNSRGTRPSSSWYSSVPCEMWNCSLRRHKQRPSDSVPTTRTLDLHSCSLRCSKGQEVLCSWVLNAWLGAESWSKMEVCVSVAVAGNASEVSPEAWVNDVLCEVVLIRDQQELIV